jgi:uncharacterized membrane protein
MPLAAVVTAEPTPRRAWGSETPTLTLAVRGLALLFVTGMSLGLGIWTARAGFRLIKYVSANDMGARGRTFILADMFGAAALLVLLALAYLVWRRRDLTRAVRRMAGVATRIAPLMLAGFLPLLLDWRLWSGRELTLLAMLTMFGLGLQGLMRSALLAPPLGIFRGWRPGDALERLLIRHPRVATWAPVTLVVLGSAVYATFFSWATVVSHHNLRTMSFDLGLEENILWNAFHWRRPFFKSSPLAGPGATHFGSHATIISYPLSLIYGLFPHAETLLILQAVVVGAAAIPLFLYARRRLGPWAAVVLAYVYLLYPPVHGANLYDFHYLPLGVFFLWTTLYALDARRRWLSVVMVIFTLMVREDVAAGLAVIGGYLLLTGQRPRAGLVVAMVGATYFVTMKLVIMPIVAKGDSFIWMFRDLVPVGDPTFGGVLKTAIANPAYLLNTLLERDKLLYLLQLFAPLAFLPLRRPIGFFCCVLGFFFTLLSTGYSPLLQTSFQYTANWTTYLFVAMVGNLAWVGSPRTPDDTEGPARRRAWLVAVGAAALVCTTEFGALFQQNTARGGFGRYTFGTTDADLQNRKNFWALANRVPPQAKVVASETLVPQIAGRPDAYTLRVGTYDADWLLIKLPIGGEEQQHALPLLEGGSFGVMEVRDTFVLAKRGYKTDQNAAVLARMR